MTETLWNKQYIHEYFGGDKNYSPRVDIWNVGISGGKTTWKGALIKRRTGGFLEAGTVPDEMRRNLELMLGD